ncbi:hypothetical protein B0H13DRAFT_2373944 [Mycena leptocephala]|nr:hypothetical protein B0H13DRAFT_2373944 [Mycena leptocephala]
MPASNLIEKKKYCHCKPLCGELLTKRTRREHYRNVSPDSILPSESESEAESDELGPFYDMEIDLTPNAHLPISPFPSGIRIDSAAAEPDDISMDFDEAPIDSLDYDSSQHESSDSESEHDPSVPADEWRSFDEDEDQEVPISREEMIEELNQMLGLDEEAALWDFRNKILTEEDRDNICAFQLKMLSNMPHIAFGQMRHAFRHNSKSAPIGS